MLVCFSPFLPVSGLLAQEERVEDEDRFEYSGEIRALLNHKTYAATSVLSSGQWFRIAVEQTGIHQITYDDLIAMGINPENLDPSMIRLFGNGNGMLPEPNSIDHPDDLTENSIYIEGEEDGIFDPWDYILFYGEGARAWNYSSFYKLYDHINNLYTDRIYYFLNIEQSKGKRVNPQLPVNDPVTHITDNYDFYTAHHEDNVNLIKSGKEWYGEIFHEQTEYSFDFVIPQLKKDTNVAVNIGLAARSTEDSYFTIYAEGDSLHRENIAYINLASPIFARSAIPKTLYVYPEDDTLNLRISYMMPNSTSYGWLDYIEINATAHLVFDGGQFAFRNARTVGVGNITQFNLEGAQSGIHIWDVSNPGNILSMNYQASPDGLSFLSPTDTLREFIAFDLTEIHPVHFIEEVSNQDLHSLSPADMVIISHPDFLVQAYRLAEHHLLESGYSAIITTPQEIYNEFSSGAQDITAIRNFLRMLYHKAPNGHGLRYLLLFGDGSYDYKERIANNTNRVPTFQSRESLKMASSFVTDDYFGLFDLSEGSNAAGDLDIGIGRFPVNTVEEAKICVDKVIYYTEQKPSVNGEWRNRISFVADDGDNNIHLKQAEELNLIVDTVDRVYNLSKIYFDSYPQLNTPSGDRYPDVSIAIDKAVRDGALLINYTGHGGELGWGDERVLDISIINVWDNINNMPAFVTATCEFSRFDDPGFTSAGELVLLNPNGGGIALFTTTRQAYSTSNFGLNKRFYEHAFDFDSMRGQYYRMGDLMKLAKTPSNSNIRNFVLLGDPVLSLAYPEQKVMTLNIRDEYTNQQSDTLKALSKVTIEGVVTNRQGDTIHDFHGYVYPTLFDKPATYSTLANDPQSKVTDFLLQDKILYKGIATVKAGLFSFTFVVPKDIAYEVDTGKLSYYALDTVSFVDAHGQSGIYIGGIDNNAVSDLAGPDIRLYLNHTEFQSGDVTTSDPVLLAYLHDESGINRVGNGIGHDITVFIDSSMTPIVLNEYYTAEVDSYQQGSILFPLGTMEDGVHTLTLKAWDVYNNSSEATLEFIINSAAPVSLTEVYNYPNPFRDLTRFHFRHNKPGQELKATVQIFDLTGKMVALLEEDFYTEMLESEPILWDGKNTSGDEVSSGVYIYRLSVTGENFSGAQQINKLMIIR